MADITTPEYAPLYLLQRCWFDALERGDSLLTPDVPVWTREHLDELLQHFIEERDATPGRNFLDKLHLQLARVSQPARHLTAELSIEHFSSSGVGRSRLATRSARSRRCCPG